MSKFYGAYNSYLSKQTSAAFCMASGLVEMVIFLKSCVMVGSSVDTLRSLWNCVSIEYGSVWNFNENYTTVDNCWGVNWQPCYLVYYNRQHCSRLCPYQRFPLQKYMWALVFQWHFHLQLLRSTCQGPRSHSPLQLQTLRWADSPANLSSTAKRCHRAQMKLPAHYPVPV